MILPVRPRTLTVEVFAWMDTPDADTRRAASRALGDLNRGYQSEARTTMLATLTRQAACVPARQKVLRRLSVAAFGAMALTGVFYVVEASARSGPQSVAPLAERSSMPWSTSRPPRCQRQAERRAAAIGAQGFAV